MMAEKAGVSVLAACVACSLALLAGMPLTAGVMPGWEDIGDDAKVVCPVRLNQEIYFEDWQPQAGSTVFCRGMKIGYDADRRPHFAYQWEWVNPHPEKEVAEVLISIPNQWDFTHRLLALTLRAIRQLGREGLSSGEGGGVGKFQKGSQWRNFSDSKDSVAGRRKVVFDTGVQIAIS